VGQIPGFAGREREGVSMGAFFCKRLGTAVYSIPNILLCHGERDKVNELSSMSSRELLESIRY